MTYIMFARWFGVVSIIISLGILFNLEDAKEMAKSMVRTETGYIMGGVLPIIFGTMSLMFVTTLGAEWTSLITVVGAAMLLAGIFRAWFVNQWKALLSKHIEKIPFLFSLFGLMLSVVLLYVGFIANSFD